MTDKIYESPAAALDGLLFDGMTVSGSYGYVDPKFKKVVDLGGNDVTDLFYFVYAPKHSFTLSADYKSAPTPLGVVEANVNYAWQDKYYTLASNPSIVTRANGLLNGRLGLSDLAGVEGLRVALWARNLTNAKYYLTHFAVGDVPVAQLGEPRSWGVDLSMAF